jgi:2-polyprenyl-6-methoxyphenol hydroxylase-like FAD-dependent oxidoreductase
MRVLIIGGGIAGPALGLFLARAGLESAVFEAYPEQAGIGGGLALAPNGMHVLDSLGLVDRIGDRGSPVDEYWFRNDRGQTLARFANASAARYGQPMVGMARATLAEVLAGALRREGVPIAYEKRLTAIEQDASGVTAHFEDGSSASGDLLVGADGVRSATRRLALPDALEPQYTGFTGVGGFVPEAQLRHFPSRDRSTMTFTFGGQGFFGVSPGGSGQMMWWTNLPRSEPLSRAEMLEAPTDMVRDELLARFDTYHWPVADLIRASEAIIQLNIFDIPSLPVWHAGRVLVIGDAAHAVSPNAGQGASLALEDAMYLGRLLSSSQEFASVFAAFERDRKPRVERIVAEGRRRGVDKQLVGPVQAKLRELMLRVMLNLFGRNADDWIYRYRIEWPETRAQELLAA